MSAIRMLMPYELHKYRDHLLRLGADDRRLRFGAPADDRRIVAFADGSDPWRTRVLARLGPNLEVVSAVHISILRDHAVELAFTVDAAFRRVGIGTALMNRALVWARNRRCSRAHITCLAENVAMRRLARHAGMEMATEGGETEAVLELRRATPLSLMAEFLAEGAGVMDFAAKTSRSARARISAPAAYSSLLSAPG